MTKPGKGGILGLSVDIPSVFRGSIMSVPPERVQRSFADAVLAAGELFAPGDRYRVFREKVLPALRRVRARMLGATLLQFPEKLPDRLTAAMVRRKARLHGYLVGAACNIGRWLRREAWRRRGTQAESG